MKKITIICCFLGLITNILLSQIPDGFSYQAVIRDSDNSLLKNQTVTVEASILRNEEVIFTQIIEGKTNENGLLSLTIGGTPEFGEIDWTDGQLFIQTRIDSAGGGNFTNETTAQMMSVPYAMAVQMAVEVAGLEFLKEKVNMLEEQVEELYWKLELPIKIPFEKYSLDDTLCKWTNLIYDDSVIIIDSEEELINYLNCMNGSYPTNDFSKYTILLASGTTNVEISEIKVKTLRKLSSNIYELEVEIESFIGSTENEHWQIAVFIPKKINNESIFELHTTVIDYSNIEDLYAQPFNIIQKCIKGKWKVEVISNCTVIGVDYPPNSIVNIDIDNNFVDVTHEGHHNITMYPLHTPFSFVWEYKEVPVGNSFVINTYIILNIDQEIGGWFFYNINNNELFVMVYFLNFSCFEGYIFSRVIENN